MTTEETRKERLKELLDEVEEIVDLLDKDTLKHFFEAYDYTDLISDIKEATRRYDESEEEKE